MKIGLLLPGDKKTPKNESRLKSLFDYLDKSGFISELIAYSDSNVKEVEYQLIKLDVVLVWVNPIQNGTDREILDSMLRRVADAGIIVSTHPETILKMGTKDVLYSTRNMSWGGDIYLYENLHELKAQFLINLKKGSRVLKQRKGNGGSGVWRIELINEMEDPKVRVLHALRDSIQKEISLSEFYQIMDEYDQLIDQPYISPMPEGMIRAYMAQNKEAGFGHQYVTALMWPSNPEEPLHPDPRLYYPKIQADYQNLRNLLENKWIPELQVMFDIDTRELPVIWDADFLIDSSSNYKLCEINVSSVYPYPKYAIPDIVATISKLLQ